MYQTNNQKKNCTPMTHNEQKNINTPTIEHDKKKKTTKDEKIRYNTRKNQLFM